eukprot:4392294-Alexandrium_andersonii.AAC.1
MRRTRSIAVTLSSVTWPAPSAGSASEETQGRAGERRHLRPRRTCSHRSRSPQVEGEGQGEI